MPYPHYVRTHTRTHPSNPEKRDHTSHTDLRPSAVSPVAAYVAHNPKQIPLHEWRCFSFCGERLGNRVLRHSRQGRRKKRKGREKKWTPYVELYISTYKNSSICNTTYSINEISISASKVSTDETPGCNPSQSPGCVCVLLRRVVHLVWSWSPPPTHRRAGTPPRPAASHPPPAHRSTRRPAPCCAAARVASRGLAARVALRTTTPWRVRQRRRRRLRRRWRRRRRRPPPPHCSVCRPAAHRLGAPAA